MKKFLSGLIIGLLITISLTVYAADMSIIDNPFPVLIDGAKAEVEGYNINGYTYLKLSDIGKTGLIVKFNETDKQIEITTGGSEKSMGIPGLPPYEPTFDYTTKPESSYYEETFTIKGKTYTGEMVSYDGKEGVKDWIFAQAGVSMYWDGEEKTMTLYENIDEFKERKNPLITITEDEYFVNEKGLTYIEYDYFTNTILPLIQ